ncbi:MAG: MACPF domain-containing protein [Clostridiales bacterium]|nr:MACPF domain-containing protein [Clostridiales bacterium]
MGNVSVKISANGKFITGKVATPQSTSSSVPESYVCVGLGYNLLASPYISPEFMVTANKIINIDASEVMNYPQTTFGQSTIITGNSVSDVYKEFNSKLNVKGTYGAFSGSVSTEFSHSSTDHEECAYTKLFAYFVKNRQSINIPDSKYRFTPEFTADLNGTLDPVALFNKYGTHLVKDIFIGGRLELNYTTKKTLNDTNTSIKADVQASYAFVSGSASAEYKTKTSQLIAKSDLNVRVVGGNSPAIVGIEDLKESYKSWCDSLQDSTKCAPCGIAEYNSLIPIWTFCKDAARRTKLDNEFQRLANGIVLPTDSYITDIFVASDKNENVSKAKCPPGYQLIDVDLNKGAGGDFIYFCLKRGKRENAITNIICESLGSGKGDETLNVKHQGVTASYRRNGADLNKGAGGKFMYLLYTKDTRYPPIRNITAYFAGDSLSDEWKGRLCYVDTTETADLNKGAGGKYIYVGYKM